MLRTVSKRSVFPGLFAWECAYLFLLRFFHLVQTFPDCLRGCGDQFNIIRNPACALTAEGMDGWRRGESFPELLFSRLGLWFCKLLISMRASLRSSLWKNIVYTDFLKIDCLWEKYDRKVHEKSRSTFPGYRLS
jgi:hypothetical protein